MEHQTVSLPRVMVAAPASSSGKTSLTCALLQAALNIEEGTEHLRYNNIIIATDADVDGMHIRILLIAFFLQFFPEVIREGHLYILQTPLFRVRTKRETFYCYTDEERQQAIRKCGAQDEITRAKQARARLAPAVRHVLEAYPLAATPQDKNDLLKTVLQKVLYHKRSKSYSKAGSDMCLTLYPLTD